MGCVLKWDSYEPATGSDIRAHGVVCAQLVATTPKMASRLNGFEEGVFVEILWDIERFNVEGRRAGERVMESVWWRGEVVEVKMDRGQTTAKIRYDAFAEFEAQVGEVRVFPFHMLLTDASNVTQLRWRYYESSGDVSYSVGNPDKDTDHGILGVCSSADAVQCQKCVNLEPHVEALSRRMDDMERFFQSQGAMFSRLSTVCNPDESCEQMFKVLRHKVAVVVQEPLPSYRQRGDHDEASNFFDWSCAVTLRTEVDCTVAQFEMACCHVKQFCDTSYFTVDGRPFSPHSGCLNASTGVAEVLFSSLAELCRALGIYHGTDIMRIARLEWHGGKKKRLGDAALRVAGTFLVDRDDEGTPAAILICRSIHEGLLWNDEVEVLAREDQDLDPRSVWYRQPLKRRKMGLLSLLKYVCPYNNNSTPRHKDALTTLRTVTGSFALRWRSVSNPNPKMWTRTMVMRTDFAGTLEVDIPYILFRGTRGVNEVKELVTDDFLANHSS